MKWVQVLVMTALVGGCALVEPSRETAVVQDAVGAANVPIVPVTMPEPAPIVDELYQDLETTVASYRDGLTLLEEGSTSAGDALMAESRLVLDEIAGRCQVVAGCNLARVVAAYQAVLAMEESVFASGEPGDMEPAEGASATLAYATGGRALDGVDLAELIQLNRYVKDALHDWLTWNRRLLIQTWENYQFLRAVMQPSWEEADLPEALLFGILAVESQGRVHSYSRAGAAGPMQFMRATAQRYGLGSANGFDERLDPAKSARASVDYLNDQFQRLGQSLEKTLAAYNAGENRLARLDRRLKQADFWSSDFFYSLPSDTRRYVPQVLAAAWLFLHPDDYGLAWPTYDGEVAELTLATEISLSELSICLGNSEIYNGWFRALRNLNAHLNPGERLPPGAVIRAPQPVVTLYPERCEDETVLAQAADLRDASESRESDLVPYMVRQGDTLGVIARRYRCVSLKELAALNDIRPPRYLIRAGKTLKVPSC